MSVDFHSLQYQFAAHLRDPSINAAPRGIEDRRLQIYRDLFYNNIEGLLAGGFPVIRAILRDDEWHPLIRDFYRDHPAHTPLFTELGREFVKYLEQRDNKQALARPFLAELAHYEWAEAALFIDDAKTTSECIAGLPSFNDDSWLHSRPQISPQAWVLAYQFPVHHIRPEFQPNAPAETPHYLILVRDHNDDVQFIETNAITALCVDVWKQNPNLSILSSLESLAAQHDVDVQSLLPHLPSLLRRLQQQHILLGFRHNELT